MAEFGKSAERASLFQSDSRFHITSAAVDIFFAGRDELRAGYIVLKPVRTIYGIMFSHRILIIAASLTSLLAEANTGAVWAEGIADGERDFVQQLQSRQFFDLAEQFCERQSENCRAADDRAAWQMMLTDCRVKHAWVLRDPGRTQLLTHTAQGITEFVRKESPSAESDLLLRVGQIEVLSTIARIDATCAEFGPAAAPHPLTTQAVSEGLQLAEAMLGQIDQIRKDIDSSVARVARDRTRYVIAELLHFQARQDSADAALRVKAAAAAEQLMRASGDNEMRFRARCLLGESSLDRKDFKGFDLLVASLTSAAENPTQQAATAALRIRGQLKREQPSDALQFCLDLEKRSLRSEELSTLRLASLLRLFELLHKLDAADLRQKTAEEFRRLDRRLGPAIKGVWKDCCERIALRFSHVERFGCEASTAIESVADLIAAGALADARRTLLAMRPSFERNRPEIAAPLLMQAGDLAVRMGDWDMAASDLASAVELFQTAQNREQEAACDLLRIYAMGRRWDAADSRGDESRTALEAAYRASLDDHMSKYQDSVTIAQAREWRAMLIQATDPVGAAEELLALDDGKRESAPLVLIQAGENLNYAVFGWHTAETPVHSDRLTAALTRWEQCVEKVLAKPEDAAPQAAFALWYRPVLELQRLMFSLQSRWSAADNWQKLASDAAFHLDALVTLQNSEVVDEQSTRTLQKQHDHMDAAKANSHAIQALAACRQLLGFDAMRDSRTFLLEQTPEKQLELAGFLLRQTSPSNDPLPGDLQLGALTLEILLAEKSAAMTVDRRLERLPLLLAASKVADQFRQFDAIIAELTTQNLTDVQLQATALVLQRRGTIITGGTASPETAVAFWQSVLNRSRSGEDQWLEASLQLATIAVQEHRFQDAAKVLNVIDALHPEWGSPERMLRAAALKARLEPAR